MPVLASKQTYWGKINIYGMRNNKIVVGYEGKRRDTRELHESATDNGKDWTFLFDGTYWMLSYDFNLILDSIGSLVRVQGETGIEKQYPFFVYGTLRRGMSNHRYYFHKKTIREEAATIQGELFVRGYSLPYMFEGDKKVHGEVMWVDEKDYVRMLADLDSLEGYNPKRNPKYNHYNRKLVNVTLSDGTQVEAWAYFCADTRAKNGCRAIPHGDYVLYVFSGYRA
jgi:gamma-glutamylcyclotransferase (GGCT)/AIG2-like uncharacterized protein YtfP